jgi:hypothetical protein
MRSIATVLLACLLGSAVSAQEAQQASEPGTLQRLAVQSGIGRCLNAVRQVGPFIAGPEGSYAVLSMSHPVAPDASAWTVSIERAHNGVSDMVSATFAPTLRGGCDVVYELVQAWQMSCQDYALKADAASTGFPVIGQRIGVLMGGATRHVYLMRTVGGCTSITKEYLFL